MVSLEVVVLKLHPSISQNIQKKDIMMKCSGKKSLAQAAKSTQTTELDVFYLKGSSNNFDSFQIIL